MLSGPSRGSRGGSDHSRHVLGPPALPRSGQHSRPQQRPRRGQNGGAVTNHAHLPCLQKGFPPHRPRVRVLVTERRPGQGLGPRGGGGCTFSEPSGGSSERRAPRAVCLSFPPAPLECPSCSQRESSPVTIIHSLSREGLFSSQGGWASCSEEASHSNELIVGSPMWSPTAS